MAASAAVGLSSTFAATIGGVLFSIEITTLYYDIGNYFKAFVAAISGTVAVSLVRTLEEGSPVRVNTGGGGERRVGGRGEGLGRGWKRRRVGG